MSYFHLMYKSQAVKLLSESQVKDIVDVSVKNNSKRKISGLLLYKNGHFLQLLEGQQEMVMETFIKIKRDPRHKSVEIIVKLISTERIFPKWDMGYLDQALVKDEINSMEPFIHAAIQYGKFDRGLLITFMQAFTNPPLKI